MADVKLSELLADSPADPLDGSEIIEVTQAGQSKGATLNQVKDFAGGGSSYLVYLSRITQSGSDAPVDNPFMNTLGATPIWTRDGVGDYVLSLIGSFPVNKTWIPNMDTSRIACNPISFGSINDYMYIFYVISDGRIELQFFDDTYNNVEMSTVFGENALTLPEIRVFS